MIIASNEKYSLRTWEKEDAPALAKHIDNKRIWDNCRDGLPFPYTIDDAHAFISNVCDKELPEFCICVDGEAVGNVGFVRGTDVERYSAEVGYWISEMFWSGGIMTDALRNAIEYYFENSEVIRLYAYVYTHNKASARVLEKAGFTFKCRMTKAAFKNGQFTDLFYYERIKV